MSSEADNYTSYGYEVSKRGDNWQWRAWYRKPSIMRRSYQQGGAETEHHAQLRAQNALDVMKHRS